jgi:hypothetical protein
MDLIQAKLSDFKIDQPIPWDLFDLEHKLLIEQGYVIKTEDEINKLVEKPVFFRNQKNQSTYDRANKDKLAKFNFGDMQLKAGDKLHLKLQSSTKISCGLKNGGFCIVTLIGYVPNKTLIVTMPIIDQLVGQPFLEDDQILVRLFSGRNAYSFTVFVEYIAKQPFKYLHLSFPKNIYGQMIRKSQRIKSKIEATVNGISDHIIITNLSITGAKITLKNDLEVILGKTIELSFELEFEEKSVPMLLHSVIKSFNIETNNAEFLFIYGIEFNNLQSEQIFVLRSFIQQEILKDPTSII